MPEKYKIFLVWMSSSICYATFAIVGAFEKISPEFVLVLGSLRLLVVVGSLSDGV